ncbi:MAG TPA: hypothetical protein DCW29_00780 [Janthinobacterium sp.]|nr:hypothetical protein [Janthinobacterium sp.]
MKILILGLPYFAAKLAGDLAAVDRDNRYVAVDTARGWRGQLACLWHMLSARTVYLIGGSTERGGALRLAMLLNKRIVMHWVGTDVLNARARCRAGTADAALLAASRHLCEVAWLREELLEVGIDAAIAQIACFDDGATAPAPWPARFSLLSYMGKGRERFYGMDKLIELAKAFPDVPLRIAGIAEYGEALPPNIQLLGWVGDMARQYRDCVLYLRLPEHDGLAFSLLEALAAGRYVGYTYAYPHATAIATPDELQRLVADLRARHEAGTLAPNTAGQSHVLEQHGRARVAGALAAILTGAA